MLDSRTLPSSTTRLRSVHFDLSWERWFMTLLVFKAVSCHPKNAAEGPKNLFASATMYLDFFAIV